MNYKKKFILVFFIFILICMFSVRVYFVNRNLKVPVTIEYKKGETVPYENDYTYDATDCINGYTVTILDSEVLTTKEFYQKYLPSMTETYSYIHWYYVVKVSFANIDCIPNKEAGINLYDCTLITKSDYHLVDGELLSFVNPDLPGYKFALRTGTDMEVTLVYPINNYYYTDKEQIQNAGFMMQITQYPNRKLLTIQ